MGEGPRPQRLAVRTPQGWVPLGYVQDDGRVYLIARERTARWPVDVLRNGEAELRLPDRTVRGPATLVTERRERAAVLEEFRSAYGPERFAQWYDHPSRVLRIDVDHRPEGNGDPERRYESWLESEFDNVADEYDRHILGNRMNRLLRDRSLAQLRVVFAGRRRLLEVGCGSGIETLSMLREGHDVLAVDISERMLSVVRSKAEEQGLSERLVTVKLRARELGRIRELAGPAEFDGAYSTYGALNCEPELRPAVEAFGALLPPGAPLVLGIYNRWCAFEVAGYSLSLQGRRALGRRSNPVLVGSSRFCIDVYAYTASEVDRLLRPEFERRRLEGVPVVLPPSDLTSYSDKFARHFDQLAALDAWVGRRWPWNRLGDHFLATYVRRPVPEGASRPPDRSAGGAPSSP